MFLLQDFRRAIEDVADALAMPRLAMRDHSYFHGLFSDFSHE
jgi:hypothetical protein